LAPVFFPCQGSLGHRPIHAHPGPVDTGKGVIRGQARLPEAQKEALLDPLLEAVVRGGTGAKAGGRKSIPLATRPQNKKDGFGAHPLRD
jgi:hypothetical protein